MAMLGTLARAALDPGGATSGIVKRVGFLIALAGLAWSILVAGIVFAGIGLYQLFARFWVAPWPALAVAVVFAGVAALVLIRPGRSKQAVVHDVLDTNDDGQLSLADATEPVARVVREHPWESVLAAVVAGVVVSQSKDLGGIVLQAMKSKVAHATN
jgi:hypothetical protein